MPDSQAQTPAQQAIGDFAPKLVTLTDDVLFGDVWERPELSKRDRSLVTVAALVTNGSTEQLKHHLVRAKDNGLRRLAPGDVRHHRCEGDLRRMTGAVENCH
jgi:4-carboxymuconolactone decarboxylase